MQLVKRPTANLAPSRWSNPRLLWAWIGAHVAVVVGVALSTSFLLAPWPFGQKVYALLHGLCAQRFSHSFLLGGQALPFDARMTGIYGGFLVAFCYLAANGRLRAWGDLSRPVIIVLATFVGVLAIDGSNSTLRDFGLWYLYEPDNRVRLATGLLTGIALATLLCYLLANTVWRNGDWTVATVRGLPEVGLLVLLQVPLAAAVLSGMGVLFIPVSLWLVAAAVAVFVAMAFALLTMSRRRDHAYRSFAEMQAPLAASLVLALVAMGTLAGVRYALEWWIGVPPML
ncbi:MAG: DUF2085 domain-containing protein [Chloroflexota bacterium]|nr:DUF2085 domain-containing protein [Chloroflexota bacterium]